jgi:hypothetical protein
MAEALATVTMVGGTATTLIANAAFGLLDPMIGAASVAAFLGKQAVNALMIVGATGTRARIATAVRSANRTGMTIGASSLVADQVNVTMIAIGGRNLRTATLAAGKTTANSTADGSTVISQ